MYKRYYDGYGRIRKDIDRGELIVPKDAQLQNIEEENNGESVISSVGNGEISTARKNSGGILQGLPIELDDLILIGLLLFLLHDSDNNDPIMLVIIVFLILGDIF